MAATEKPVIVWFRRNLRLHDNAALGAAERDGAPVVPVFVRDPPDPSGQASDWWLHRSLASLDADLATRGSSLLILQGPTETVLPRLATEIGAGALHLERGHEPGVAAREQDISTRLSEHGIATRRFAGRLLADPDRFRTGAGGPYRVFTPFWKALRHGFESGTPRPAPERLTTPTNLPDGLALEELGLVTESKEQIAGWEGDWQPGEAGAREALADFVDGPMADYPEGRDLPGRVGTSRLSPHLHFGEVSIRTAWHVAAQAAVGGAERGGEAFLRELGWRDFGAHLLHHFPRIVDEPLQKKFDTFPWRDDAAALQRWQDGLTGYPLVDAGMRQLRRTGWMHNRVRMVAASFLVKHLLIDWRAGERWFRDCLVDFDPASNIVNWQWVAGSGADAAPYFRIFNPVLQGTRFDRDGAYVRRWLAEIADLPDRYLHHPWDAPATTLEAAGIVLDRDYPAPMVDHAFARKRALSAFQSLTESEKV
ncbi:cryptochrome/photolyase family protein [Oceanibacterium hippocampi]|uniref:Deoxyribodipyrimidine photo-lyase n=1 Tax=Oceanibacterium hippocampi TaxID=745714 RepID=A0A1Y5TW37_9PROT|nr:deoxyribodipyrimidine photo-lyase [Oceanibacterium hippocampi]SLN74853.1 Deoxyribodipyrimidine photo-lyase [Oceanibacterium hippocampi]